MIRRKVGILWIFTVVLLFSVTSRQAYGWSSYLPNHHGEMTRDALSGLGWTDDEIGDIPEYAEQVDNPLTGWPHCEKANHRVEKYQKLFEEYGGEECKFLGAEWYAKAFLTKSWEFYAIGDKDKGEKYLGYAIHFIQDAVNPPHVFPFKEKVLHGPHFNFEQYAGWSYGYRNWPSLVKNAPVTQISSPEDLYNKLIEAADWVYNDIPCSYIRMDDTWVIDLRTGSIEEIEQVLQDKGWKMSDEDIGRIMEKAASLVKGAAIYARFGVVAPITNVDVVLVIDRSGSMVYERDPTTGYWYYSPQKMENAKWAAKQFVDLMQIGDMVGVISFSSYVRVDYPLSEITSTDTKTAVKKSIDLIYASGMTAMGDGLRTAYNQLVSYGDPSHPWAIVLMSNGWHNWGTEHPYDVIPDLKSKNIRVYTVGLGEGADSSLLEHIASETGGFYRFAPTSEDLLEIYNDIAARVGQAQTISSASGLVAVGETSQLSVDIDSSVTQTTFTVSWRGSDLDLTLIRPDGTVVDPSVAVTNPDIEYIEEARYEIYRINNPMAGTWQMVITAIDVPPEGESFFTRVTALTTVTLTLETDKDSYTYPEPLKITAILEDTGIPLIGANVQAFIKRPDASQIALTLFDDGLDVHGDMNSDDGVYTNYFNQFNEDGSYTIKVIAKGTTLIGENFLREAQKTVLVSGVPTDIKPPTTTLFIGSPQYIDVVGNLYVTSATPFTLSAVDNNGGGSGVASTAYRIYNTTYNTGWLPYTAPFNLSGFSDGAYNIDYNSTDNVGNVEPTNTIEVNLDNTGPTVTIVNPPIGWALQDGVTFMASAFDAGSGTASLNFSIREANGAEGIPVGFEDLPATYNATTDKWTLFFDTLLLPDGYYVVLAKAKDNLGNLGPVIIVSYSIRNWAVIELLPASETNKAGRTTPVKFSLRVVASVDPSQPFVYNEELIIQIYATNNPEEILQESTFGDHARDYRIDTADEHYITNFRTLKTPMEYTVTIYRDDFEIGSFTFQTVK